MAAPRKYLALLAYLAALPADQASVTLTFAELEALLGWPLSGSARVLTSYWTASYAARSNWQRAGWTARLDHARGAVTFTRR